MSIRPPETDPEVLADPQREVAGFHWDVGGLYNWPELLPEGAKSAGDGLVPLPFSVQGVLYLTDTPAENGAFSCIPGFHKKIDGWLQSLPPDVHPQQVNLLSLGPSLGGRGPERVGGEAGDLVIWSTTLPHYSAINIGDAPRVAQYITYGPAPAAQDEDARSGNIRFWQDRLAGNGNADNERGQQTRAQPQAKLSPQGQKLAGLVPWEGPEEEQGYRGLSADWTVEAAAGWRGGGAKL